MATQMHSFWEGEAALPGLTVALGEVGVVDAELVNPNGIAQHDPVLVAGYRGEHAVAPLEGRLVGVVAQLGRTLDGDVVAHERDGGDPGGERLAAALEDGAREGVELPAAAAAAPPQDAGRGGRDSLGERADAELFAAVPLTEGFSEQPELVGGQARHERPEGIRFSHMDLPHLPERPPGGIVAKQRSEWALGQILCLTRECMVSGALQHLIPSTVI